MENHSKLIVFDLDGTLYLTGSSFLPAVKCFLERHQMAIPADEFLHRFIGEPEHVFTEWLESLQIDAPIDELLKEFDRLMSDAIECSGSLYESVDETLETLYSRGYLMAICSNGPQWYIDQVLDKFEIGRYFSIVKVPSTRDETKGHMLRDILEHVNPGISCMVGDRIHDLQAARENGTIFIGTAYGYGGGEIRDADHIVHAFADLKNVVE